MSNKIGIVTYLNNYNYGSVLQAYALTELLCGEGYDASVIDCLDLSLKHNQRMRLRTLRNRLFCSILNPSCLIKEFKRIKSSNATIQQADPKKVLLFDHFQAEQMRISKENYLVSDSFDAFICGSDQIWKLTVPGLHELFFLRFATKGKRIAYAPSFGSDFVPKYNLNRLRKYLSEIPYISVRETSGIGIIENVIGRTVPQVLDPVLLVGSEFWRTRFYKKKISARYILCYFLDENKRGIALAEKLAQEKNLEIILLGTGNTNCVTAKKIIPSPFEFVQMIDEADCVITDSYHGIAFSIMMNTLFFAFDRNYCVSPEQSTRIESLLNLMGLQSRKCSDNHTPVYEADFAYSNERLQLEREKSKNYLFEALANTLK